MVNTPIKKPKKKKTSKQDGHILLGKMLIKEHLITKENLKKANAKADATGHFLGQTLVELGYIDQSDLISVLVKQAKIPLAAILFRTSASRNHKPSLPAIR